MKKLFTIMMVLLATALPLAAQNVFISPETGHLIAAVTYQEETGFQNGFSALWRHDQLGLSLVVADDAQLTSGGEIKNPAGNLNIVDGKLTLTGGQSADCYIVVSLPKGYRFTGYAITLSNNLNDHRFSPSFETAGVAKTLYETNSNFALTSNDRDVTKAHTDQMPATNDTKAYTINRQASSKTDMGNRLYFRLHKPDNINYRYYGVTISSFVVNFAADADFQQPLMALPFSSAVSVAESSFMVGKPELGTIKPNTKGDNTYFSYDYRNVDDLEAENLLYQASAVNATNGLTNEASATTKTITRTINRDGLDAAQPWFALSKGASDDDNTYYVETPVSLTSATNHSFPTGYRITGAKFEFALGQRDNGGYTIGADRHGEITYLQSNATMGSGNPVTGWRLDNNRRLSLNNTYVYVRSSQGNYYLSTSSRNIFDSPASFYVDENNYIYCLANRNTRYYIHESDISGQPAVLTTDRKYAARLISYPAFTPSSTGFKAEVFDKTGANVAETADISSTNNNQTIELTGLNNDAVKFRISGLADGSQALVRITLTMEHLNPYVHSMQVIGRDAQDPSQQPLTGLFSTDNFNIRGQRFVFPVPSGTSSHTWNFEFDNLTSNYTDDSYKSVANYAGATDGNARVSFVESAYFHNNENLYADSYNPDYTPVSDKLQVINVGTVPFRFNNADELSNESASEVESQLEEYPFSVDTYTNGFKDANGNTVKGSFEQLSLTQGQEKIAYIIVSDETKYNIAPTWGTQHRYYAHYAMDIDLEEREYPITVTPVKVYNETFYTDAEGHEKTSSMWGLKVTTQDNGYAPLTEVISKISEAVDNNQNGLDDLSQVLYVDMSSIQSLMMPSNITRDAALNSFRQMMAPNCLVYLPTGMADKVNNFANRPQDGGQFTANANIILTDKTPFFAPENINVPSTAYAKYTRQTTHSSTGKSQITTLVLPFQFSVSETDGTHFNDNGSLADNSGNREGDGKTFTVSRLAATGAISKDKGDESLGDLNNDMVSYDNYVHFDVFKPGSKKSEAYEPYLIYISKNNQLGDDDNFSVLEYGANVIKTPTTTTTDGEIGQEKIASSVTAKGTLDNESCTLTPSASMSGCTLDKNNEKCLYFSADRFRSSWSLTDQYNEVYVFPFRSWFAYDGSTRAKSTAYGIAFGTSEATGIDDINTDKQEKAGTYKMLRNGQIYIHTDKGVYTVDGRKVNL